jgi:putative membrane protein
MRTSTPILMAAFAVALTACAKGDATADSTAATATAGASATAAGSDSAMSGMTHDSANSTNNGWGDGQILGYTTAVNNDEIAEGKLASTKARHPEVKAFAAMMVKEHQAMLAEGTAFASSHNVTADTTKDDITSAMKDGRESLKDFTDKAAGADWDKDYLDHQIEEHEKVLGKLEDAAKGTANTDLRAMLVKATGKVQEHLTKARALKEKYPA